MPAKLVGLLGALLLLQAMAQAQTWTDVPGWPGLKGLLKPEDFPSPQLSFSASPDTLTFWWPAYGSNFILESSTDLSSGVWTREVDVNRFTVGDTTITTVPFNSEQKYFRLEAPLTFAVPIFEFAIFYDSLLEFTWQASFTVNGPVYADADIFVGSSANLTFNSPVMTTRGIYKTNWDGHTVSQMTGTITYNANPPHVTNAARIEVPFGTNNSPAAIREMLNLPPPGVNGAIIPTNGLPSTGGGWTVATPNPLYIWGNYNIGPGGSTLPGNTDTSKTYPAALISDALTILSGNWADARSFGSLGSRPAVNTTVNAAILTGTVYSTDASSNHFSGGVMNVTRLLEDWSGDTLTLNTSIVNLFDSAHATNRFVNPGVYYLAPTRQFSFDQNFTNFTKLPPGTPFVRLSVAPP